MSPHCYICRCLLLQVMCDADLRITNCVAKWPGSVHDARILRESPLFAAFESNRKPLSGFILGDSGYMLRNWLLTPVLHVRSRKDETYNTAHCGTRCTIERCIGVLKRRWHCLHTELRIAPHKACEVICACVVLHNRATEFYGNDNNDVEHNDDDSASGDDNSSCAGPTSLSEQARVAAGKAARERLINNVF